MAVVSAVIPTVQSGFLGGRAALMGVEVEVVDREDGMTYVDVTGTAEKALLTLLGAGATVLDVTNYTESTEKKDARRVRTGRGIPNHGESEYSRVVRLMGKPKY